MNSKVKLFSIIMASFIAFCLLVRLLSNNSNENNKTVIVSEKKEQTAFKATKQDAVVWSHVFVEERLKSPGSADFPYQADETIDQINDSSFIVLSYVDFQNDFGALKRTYYKCNLIFRQDETAYCTSLKLE